MKDDRAMFEGMTRRMALSGILLGGAGLALDRFFPSLAWAGDPPKKGTTARAKAVIQIWMWGGPCHIDTFDPKEAGYDYCGPLGKPIATNVDGTRLSPLLPLLAGQADKFSIIRSMTHGNDGHETAAYIVQTGHTPAQEDRLVYPCVGSTVSAFRGYGQGYDKQVAPFVVLTEPVGRFSEEGFLGQRYRPFVTGGDPNQKRFAVEGIVAEGVSDERQKQRRQALHELDALGKALPKDAELARYDGAEEKAYELVLGSGGKVFDLSQEKDALRDKYGRNKFGQSCLMARRLVEYGVPYVVVNYGGWDTHKEHFETMKKKLPELDQGLATLFSDLADRGLLSSTVVWCGGEFGRTPKIQWEAPWNGGRGHYGRCFSTVVGGGGFKGGHVVGASDAKGTEVAERPVHPRDLIASIYTLLGIDPEGPMPNPAHNPRLEALAVRVLPPASVGGRGAGKLTEIL